MRPTQKYEVTCFYASAPRETTSSTEATRIVAFERYNVICWKQKKTESLEQFHADLAPSRSRDLLLFLVFSETKTIRSCANIMASSKDVGLYAFTLALRPSGANANAQLILPGENFSKENSDKF